MSSIEREPYCTHKNAQVESIRRISSKNPKFNPQGLTLRFDLMSQPTHFHEYNKARVLYY